MAQPFPPRYPLLRPTQQVSLGRASLPAAAVWSRGFTPWRGVHVRPQTAARTNVFTLELGGGADWRWRPWLGVRLEAAWARSQLFSQGQNNLRADAGFVLHA